MAQFTEKEQQLIKKMKERAANHRPPRKRLWFAIGAASIALIIGAGIVTAHNNAENRKRQEEMMKDKEKNLNESAYQQNSKLDGDIIKDEDIASFELCVKKYPAFTTYPEQCKTADGRTFAKDTDQASVITATPSVASSRPASTPAPTPVATSTPVPTIQSTLPLGTVITPYVNESDIISANEAFSLDANNPYWGFWHPGVDFMVDHDISVQAAASGTIENLETKLQDGIMGWHTGFCINTGTQNSVCYNLETFGSDQTFGDRQKAAFLFKNGDHVNRGDIIGTLVYGGEGAHIDFGITAPGTRVCPEPYLTEDARASVLRIIHIKQPAWPMCYP